MSEYSIVLMIFFNDYIFLWRIDWANSDSSGAERQRSRIAVLAQALQHNFAEQAKTAQVIDAVKPAPRRMRHASETPTSAASKRGLVAPLEGSNGSLLQRCAALGKAFFGKMRADYSSKRKRDSERMDRRHFARKYAISASESGQRQSAQNDDSHARLKHLLRVKKEREKQERELTRRGTQDLSLKKWINDPNAHIPSGTQAVDLAKASGAATARGRLRAAVPFDHREAVEKRDELFVEMFHSAFLAALDHMRIDLTSREAFARDLGKSGNNGNSASSRTVCGMCGRSADGMARDHSPASITAWQPPLRSIPCSADDTLIEGGLGAFERGTKGDVDQHGVGKRASPMHGVSGADGARSIRAVGGVSPITLNTSALVALGESGGGGAPTLRAVELFGSADATSPRKLGHLFRSVHHTAPTEQRTVNLQAAVLPLRVGGLVRGSTTEHSQKKKKKHTSSPVRHTKRERRRMADGGSTSDGSGTGHTAQGSGESHDRVASTSAWSSTSRTINEITVDTGEEERVNHFFSVSLYECILHTFLMIYFNNIIYIVFAQPISPFQDSSTINYGRPFSPYSGRSGRGSREFDVLIAQQRKATTTSGLVIATAAQNGGRSASAGAMSSGTALYVDRGVSLCLA